jgi:hypothetical protein
MGAIRVAALIRKIVKRQTVGTARVSPRTHAIRTGLVCGVVAFTAAASMPNIAVQQIGRILHQLQAIFFRM